MLDVLPYATVPRAAPFTARKVSVNIMVRKGKGRESKMYTFLTILNNIFTHRHSWQQDVLKYALLTTKFICHFSLTTILRSSFCNVCLISQGIICKYSALLDYIIFCLIFLPETLSFAVVLLYFVACNVYPLHLVPQDSCPSPLHPCKSLSRLSSSLVNPCVQYILYYISHYNFPLPPSLITSFYSPLPRLQHHSAMNILHTAV